MAALPEGVSDDFKLAIDELESAVAEMESRLESARAERDEARAREIAIGLENAKLRHELALARERQAASAEILSAISEAGGDADRALTRIAEVTGRLFGAPSVTIRLAAGEEWGKSINYGASSFRIRADVPAAQRALSGENLPGTVFRENRQIHIPDLDNIDPSMAHWPVVAARAEGTRTVSGTPLRREGKPIGALLVFRDRLAPFTDEELALQQSFADQAVIAIENARLFNETQEALERQTATADILKVIASSPSDTTPVFDAIAGSAKRLLDGFSAAVFRYVDGMVRLAAFTPTNPVADQALRADFPTPVADFAAFRLTASGEPFPIPDTENVGHTPVRDIARLHGFRSMLWVPMVSGGVTMGVISVTRVEPGAFAPHHTRLLQTFADQAVIAIENARLFNETQDALERQTATADILKVIAGSPADVEPVFDAIAASAKRLIGGFSAAVFRFVDGLSHLTAFTPSTPEADEVFRSTFPRPVDEFDPFQLAKSGRPVPIPDVEDITNDYIKNVARARGFRSMLFVPLMNAGIPIGLISVTRVETGSFAPNHIELLQTFADQAIIAIENTRLFNEVQARTHDLEQALTYQTGSSNILRVIASSPTDIKPVLDAIVESACELCGAYDAVLRLKSDDMLELVAHRGPVPADWNLSQINPHWTAGRAALERAPVHVHDMSSSEGDEFPEAQARAREHGHRTILSVPLLREGGSVGTLTLRRLEVNPFSEKQVALLQTFADQAVIAIGNVRLFEEVQAKTRDLSESLQQQTATADVLKVISRSAFDLQAVLDTLVSSASTLCSADQAMLLLFEDGILRPLSYFGAHADKFEFRKSLAAAPDRGTLSGRAVLEGRTLHATDVFDDPEFTNNSWQQLTGFRAMLAVPLMRQEQPIGAMALSRTTPGLFAERQVELVQTFADQAVIAIENARLFDQVQQRTRELSKSLDDLRTAQDRLVQTEKLASLGQLTAGIAHEIKNPLNFVNNFASLSAELTVELKDVLKQTEVGDKIRAEVDELTALLKDNLEKVVQHGKRADSIVKNMLLHSREGGGEHRPSDINALLDESLNLAYHGARAEKPDFNVTLQRDFDPAAGMLELFPQEITRVFLNLVSNGFYAVTKRRKEGGEPDFEPKLQASTKNLGESVEIRIRDNGIGIPPEVKEKMFNPFFTTKPAGEGTGLGLSMSHDIIVKQHGGTIDVDTFPGHFTEFRIVLPRTSNIAEKTRG